MRSYHRGITLIELMIVVAVVGLLAAIAYPSYRDQIMRSHRSDAKIALERAAQTLERCFTNSSPKSYAGCMATPFNSDNGYYSVAVTQNALDFSITATAVGSQLRDTACRTFTLTSANARTARTAANADSPTCWSR